MKTITGVAPAACAIALFGMAQAGSAELLFADSFDRADSTVLDGSDLNGDDSGKSGSLGALQWGGLGADGTIGILNNQLRATRTGTTNGDHGGKAWLEHNFTGLTEFTVTIDINGGSSNGNSRHAGFGVGQSLAEITTIDSAEMVDHTGTDVQIGWDNIGNPKGISIWEAGVLVAQPNPGLSAPDTLSATFTSADMNAGTTLNYEVFFNGSSIYTGSTTWSGTDENYISIMANYTNTFDFDNFSVQGVPEPGSLALLGLGGLMIARRRRG